MDYSTAIATIRAIDHDDVAALERHVAFENAHGQARFNVDELRAWLPTVDAALLLAAEDASGDLVGCSTASVVAALGPRSVQMNGFCRPGEHQVLRALADEIAQWDGAPQAESLLAHVSNPTPEQEAAWLGAGFTCVGTRARVERVPTLDGLPNVALPANVDIFPLADRPELADATLRVWNESHSDIPSPLPFGTVDEPAWRKELGVGPGDPFPASLLVAATRDGEVAGVAFLDTGDDVGGHRFTGTARAWRGQRIATALKVATIEWAAANGIKRLRASNDSDNDAIRALNDRLGYEMQFRIVMFQRATSPAS